MSEFIELTDDNFQSSLEGVPTALVDYYATWCGACRMAAPMFKRVTGDFKLPLFKVDAEKYPDCRESVEIENLPTIALFRQGKVVASLCTTKEDALRAFLAEHGVK